MHGAPSLAISKDRKPRLKSRALQFTARQQGLSTSHSTWVSPCPQQAGCSFPSSPPEVVRKETDQGLEDPGASALTHFLPRDRRGREDSTPGNQPYSDTKKVTRTKKGDPGEDRHLRLHCPHPQTRAGGLTAALLNSPRDTPIPLVLW